MLDLRCKQSDEDAKQNSPRVRRLAAPVQGHDPLGDQPPLGVGDPRGLLEQLDGLEGDARPLDCQEGIQSVERGGETVYSTRRRSRRGRRS